ncbi:VanZ family protein [Paenibacillus qinlingensis]|uniref:Glycopeptide antibiotics resistance protein n=1 Tax=Paenibacillus qinlingensis TaxID=1837343 RepID=A0ABU1NR94_9BACL|nr:VanZ family protein [Paenibacillus qinlingensis]MDR6549965.1 glycopeptide antibiotics resistance protein [Paenibacillus qinlingensis]
MKKWKVWHEMLLPALFALYMYVLFKIILFKFSSIDLPFVWQQLQRNLENPIYIQNRLAFANFQPFVSITANLQRLSQHDLINLFGNIAVFMPYGMFLLLTSGSKKISFSGVFIRSLGVSLSLESLQVVLSMGSFDVDDLILNVLGGLVGYCGLKLGLTLKDRVLRMIDMQSMSIMLTKESNIT